MTKLDDAPAGDGCIGCGTALLLRITISCPFLTNVVGALDDKIVWVPRFALVDRTFGAMVPAPVASVCSKFTSNGLDIAIFPDVDACWLSAILALATLCVFIVVGDVPGYGGGGGVCCSAIARIGDWPMAFSRRCRTRACFILSNGYSRDSMTFDGTGVGSMPSMGQIVFGDLKMAFASTGPFKATDGSIEFTRMICCFRAVDKPLGPSPLPAQMICGDC